MIKLKNVGFAYSGASQTGSFALSDINLEIRKGEFIALIGPNGCGKSTLLKIISGLLKPSAGHIEIDSSDYSDLKINRLARSIAFVPQAFFSAYPFSVHEIVMMGRTPYLNYLGFENEKDTKIADEAIEMLAITDLKHKGINEISGGEAQRVFIARAFAQEPVFLLLDEPNAHLDLEHQISIFSLLKKLNEEKNLTVVAVTHDLNLVGLFAHRTVIMQNGRVVLDADTYTALTKENIKENFNVDSSVLKSGINKAFNVVINPDNV